MEILLHSLLSGCYPTLENIKTRKFYPPSTKKISIPPTNFQNFAKILIANNMMSVGHRWKLYDNWCLLSQYDCFMHPETRDNESKVKFKFDI